MKLWPFTKSSARKPLKAGMPVMVSYNQILWMTA